jgi:hypothetical protein
LELAPLPLLLLADAEDFARQVLVGLLQAGDVLPSRALMAARIASVLSAIESLLSIQLRVLQA